METESFSPNRILSFIMPLFEYSVYGSSRRSLPVFETVQDGPAVTCSGSQFQPSTIQELKQFIRSRGVALLLNPFLCWLSVLLSWKPVSCHHVEVCDGALGVSVPYNSDDRRMICLSVMTLAW